MTFFDGVIAFFEYAGRSLYYCLIHQNRWIYFLNGAKITIIISLLSVLIGTVLGVLLALSKISTSRNFFMRIIRGFSKAFIDVIRGTPTVVQLLIIYFVIFSGVDLDRFLVAVIAFSINAAAYIAEIIRAGVLSIDVGQTEAGRSLGLSHTQTMSRIIMPQAVKNILPALGNEFITLVKETSVASFIGTAELVHVQKTITSITYDGIWPYLIIGVIYYIIVKILTVFLNMFERWLRKSDAR